MNIKIVSDHNLQQEETLRALSYYDYNFHILALKRRQESLKDAESS